MILVAFPKENELKKIDKYKKWNMVNTYKALSSGGTVSALTFPWALSRNSINAACFHDVLSYRYIFPRLNLILNQSSSHFFLGIQWKLTV